MGKNKHVCILIVGLFIALSMLSLTSNAYDPDFFVGAWFDDSPHGGSAIIIYLEKGKPFMERKYAGKNEKWHIIELIQDGGSIGKATYRYKKDKSGTGDHYVINKNDFLEIRDNAGLISTARSMDIE